MIVTITYNRSIDLVLCAVQYCEYTIKELLSYIVRIELLIILIIQPASHNKNRNLEYPPIQVLEHAFLLSTDLLYFMLLLLFCSLSNTFLSSLFHAMVNIIFCFKFTLIHLQKLLVTNTDNINTSWADKGQRIVNF